MKVGYCQTKPIFSEKELNFKNVESLCRNKNADLLVLPELFNTGYTFTSKDEVEALAETSSGTTSDFLINLAQQVDGIVVGGFVEQEGDKYYNSAIIASKHQILGVYRKIHLFYKEKLWFEPGNLGFKIFSVNNVNIGVMICFDWIFPEAMRTLSLKGADIIAHPANLVLPYCQNAMVTRCIENHVFEITANRIGIERRGEDSFIFTGLSQITACNGEILHRGNDYREEMYTHTINPEEARNKQLNEFNQIFQDRRTEFYS
jgi:predicted amidohydrolase